MTSRPWKDWPAQAPLEGFAARTVEALLVQEAKVVPLRRRRRWVVVLACAAALAGGTSWAMMRYYQGPQMEPAGDSQPVVASPPMLSLETPTARFVVTKDERVPPPPPPPVISAPRASASSSSVPPTSAPPKVIMVPRCNCEPGTQICACVH
jgi:hypothetical protein